MPADILLYALIAAGLVFWLRSILGTRHGDERSRPNPFTSQETDNKAQVETPAASEAGAGIIPFLDNNTAERQLPRHVSVEDAAEAGLNDITKADKTFDIEHFAKGAEGAFIMIVEAFAKGDRGLLGDLLGDNVYKAFDGAISEREKSEQTMETEIHSVRKINIVDAMMKDKTALVTVAFAADETCITKDKEGTILSGDPERITEMNDIWVFARDIKSKDPVWLLVETRDGHPENESQTPLPDAS